MNEADSKRINELASKMIEGTITSKEEMEFVYLYTIYELEYPPKSDSFANLALS